MSTNDRIKEIIFPDKYVNQQAKDILTDNTQNTYAIKASTGQGVTTALLNHPIGNLYVLSPNVGMIIGKEKERQFFKSQQQFFIYNKSEDKWKDVEEYLDTTDISEQNMILNTTPDQLLILWKTQRELYERISNIHVFVDEIHAYFEDSTLREDMGATLELIYNEWKASFTLSTATPTYDLLDIPKNKDVQCFKLIREHDSVREIQYTDDFNHLDEFVYDEHSKGRIVVVFSNNIRVHKRFTDLRVANMVGDSLAKKLGGFGRGNLGDRIVFSNYDVIILSSKYYAGYDLKFNYSVCIVSEQDNEAHKINIKNLVQTYGRCRCTVHKALYINKTSTFDTNKQLINVASEIQEVDKAVGQYESEYLTAQTYVDKASSYFEVAHLKCVTQGMHVNRSKLFAQVRDKINDYHQYNKDVFVRTLKGYNFEVIDYISTDAEKRQHDTTKLNQRLLNLLEKPEWEFRSDYPKIKYNIRHLKKGTFNSKLAFEYLTAWIMSICDSQVLNDKLHNKSFNAKDFYKSMDLFLRANVDTTYYSHQLTEKESSSAKRLYFDEGIQESLKKHNDLTNDWQMLYMIHQINSRNIPAWIRHEMATYIEAHDYELYVDYKDSTNRVRDVLTAITNRLNELKEHLIPKEIELLREVVKDVFDRLDKKEKLYKVDKKSLKKKLTDYLIFLLTDGNGNHKSKLKKNREYNAIVTLPKRFRNIASLIYLEIDLTSATPQLIDQILGSSIGLDVYSNLMKAKGISRDMAKQQFNSTVNNHKLKPRTVKGFYLKCGFKPDDALALTKLTAQVPKGSFYEMITANEKTVVEKYQHMLGIRSHRFHDGLVLSQESIDENHITIPANMDGFIFHVDIFNDGSPYGGPTTDVQHDSKRLIDNWHF